MNKRDEILKNIDSPEDRILCVKIIDCIEQVKKYYEPKYTQFMDPAQISKSKRIIEQFGDVHYTITSGIQGCERNIIAVYPDYMDEADIFYPLDAICIEGKSRFESIEHRDVLGALMSLGIKREKIGDIIKYEDRFYILVYRDIKSYITMNLLQIKHTPVSIEDVDFSSIPVKQQSFKEISTTVASLRLDALVSAGYGESRSSISKHILSGNVKVNWEEVTDLSHSVKEGDVISLKGKGRIILDRVGSVTRKGRISIIIKRII